MRIPGPNGHPIAPLPILGQKPHIYTQHHTFQPIHRKNVQFPQPKYQSTFFIFNPTFRDNLNHQKFGNTDLERQPLLYDGKKIILVLPTAVSIAIRRFVFEWLYKNGLVESFEKNFVGEYIELLQETPILGRPLPSGLPIHPQKVSEAYFFEAMAEIERGRYLQVILRIDTLHGLFKEGMDTPAPHSQEQMEEVERRIQLAKKSFLAKDGYREGLSLG